MSPAPIPMFDPDVHALCTSGVIALRLGTLEPASEPEPAPASAELSVCRSQILFTGETSNAANPSSKIGKDADCARTSEAYI